VGFLATDYSNAKSIVQWPEQKIDRIEEALLALSHNTAPSAETRSLLSSARLLSEDGKLTPLGSHLQYNSLEYEWQMNQDVFEGLIAMSDLPPAPRILDVGCGSGQTLRRLDIPLEGLSVGVDISADALAYGSMIYRNGRPDFLSCASAHSLPFRDQSFDFVICRGSINYCHQKTALREAIRVLRRGGFLFCHLEQIWWDLRILSQPKSVLGKLFDLRNFLWGLFHQATGLQPAPGGVFRGSRAYSSKGRFKKFVEPLGCDVLRYEDTSRGPHYRGHSTKAKVLCRRLAA
jgi:SAM-dependent methyltransferase